MTDVEGKIKAATETGDDRVIHFIQKTAFWYTTDVLSQMNVTIEADVRQCFEPVVSHYVLFILCSIESVDSSVTMFIKILKNSRWFRPRRAVGFDRTEGTVHTLDETQYACWIVDANRLGFLATATQSYLLVHTEGAAPTATCLEDLLRQIRRGRFRPRRAAGGEKYSLNYTLSHRKCRHPRHLHHATSADFEMISTTTGS